LVIYKKTYYLIAELSLNHKTKTKYLMKNLIVFAFIAIFGTTTAFASNPIDIATKELRNEIVKLLDAPQIELTEEETLAQVRFIMNSKGEIVILSVVSNNDQVDTYIKRELNYKKIKNLSYTIGKVFVMPLKIMKPSA